MADREPDLNSRDDSNDKRQLVMVNCIVLTSIADGASSHPADAAPTASGQPNAAASGDRRFEDEVNGYIESLMETFDKPASTDHAKPFLFDYDIEALRRLDSSKDAQLRYTILKGKQDVVILSVGLFDKAGEKAVPLGPEFKHGSQGQMGRGEAYFHFAFAYTARVSHVAAAVRELDKNLSAGLFKFAAVLAYMTSEPLALETRLAEADVFYLTHSAELTAKRHRLERKQNEFLDAYLEWRQCSTIEARKRVIALADQLKSLDPGFSFVPEE